MNFLANGLIVMIGQFIASASMFCFLTLEKSINKFRSEAIITGIPLGVSMIKPPKENEIVNIESFINSIEAPKKET